MKIFLFFLFAVFSFQCWAQNQAVNDSSNNEDKEFTLRQKVFFSNQIYIFKIDKVLHSNENIIRGEVLKTFKDSMSVGTILDIKLLDNFSLLKKNKEDYLNSYLFKKEMTSKKINIDNIEKDIIKNDIFLMIENFKSNDNVKIPNAYIYLGNNINTEEINKKILKLKEQDILPHHQTCSSNSQCSRISYGCGGETSVNHALAPFIQEKLFEKYGDPKTLNCTSVKYNNDEKNIWLGSSCVKNTCGIYYLNRIISP